MGIGVSNLGFRVQDCGIIGFLGVLENLRLQSI